MRPRMQIGYPRGVETDADRAGIVGEGRDQPPEAVASMQA
jgi:hypothetical protein